MKHYLIDSENVGDFWIPLLTLPQEDTELIVFFTKNSPHMSYDSLIKLKESDRKVIFVKCYEGTNALDFQLCSELGFLISQNEEDDFIIVTSDAGYDAAVKYWRHKGYSVKRIAGKDSRPAQARRRGPVRIDVLAEVNAVSAAAVDEAADTAREEQMEEVPETTAAGSDTDADTLDAPAQAAEVAAEEESEAVTDVTAGDGGEPETVEEFSLHDVETDVKAESESDEDDEILDVSDEKVSEIVDEVIAETVFEEDEETSDVKTSEDKTLDVETSDAETSDVETSEDKTSEEAAEPDENNDSSFREDEITAIVNCIGHENLAELHNQLIQFYGESGKEIYLSIKSGTNPIESLGWSRQEKFLYYCALIFRHSDEFGSSSDEENVRELADFLLANEKKRQNLNALRYALIKHYGKETGQKYYFMVKSYVKAMNQM